MTRRLLLSYVAITVVILALLEGPLGVFYAQRERDRFTNDVARDAGVLATLYEDDLEASSEPDPRAAAAYEVRTGARVVLVDRGGVSVLDTGGAIDRDFSTRPEVAAALGGPRRRAPDARTPSTPRCSTWPCRWHRAGWSTVPCASPSMPAASTSASDGSGPGWPPSPR